MVRLPTLDSGDVLPEKFLPASVVMSGELVLNVKDYGAVGDGITDDTAAIQAAVDALKTKQGATLIFPNGTYLFSSMLNLDNLEGSTLMGSGMAAQDYLTGNTAKLVYTNTASPAIRMENAGGLQFEGLMFQYNNELFTGTLIQMGHGAVSPGVDTSEVHFNSCIFAGTALQDDIKSNTGAKNADMLVDLTGSDTTGFFGCTFGSAKYAVGRPDSRTYMADVALWQKCKFLPTIWGAQVYNPANSWTFDSCKIHGSIVPGETDVRVPAFLRIDEFSSLPRFIHTTSITNCWFGDASNAIGTDAWIEYEGTLLSVTNCAFWQGGPDTWAVRVLDTTETINFSGNRLNIKNGIDIASKVVRGVALIGNTLSGTSGSIIANYANIRNLIQSGNFDNNMLNNGTLIGGSNFSKIGFFNAVPVTKPSALTAANITAATGTDAAIIENLRTRINELESKLQSLGLLS